MSLAKETKQKTIGEYSRHDKDVGSPEVQVAVLTKKIEQLTEHFRTHNQDNHSRRGLLNLVNKRRKLLSYLSKKDNSKYLELIKKLNLRR